MITPENLLHKYWKHDSFRKPQAEIIQAVLQDKNVLALLPTGAGKSLCFQIPTLLKEGVCIVISPLIALMNDQVDSLNRKGIKSIALTSKYSFDETIIAFDNLKFGGYKFLYLSPEKLQSELIQEKIKQLNVNLIAVDEAHCISEWGHDFRPSYLKINTLQKLHPNVNTIALTATATPKVIEDVLDNLNIEKISIFKKSFFRKNLSYQIKYSEDILNKLIQILSHLNEPVIIYTNTRKSCINISNFLNKNKFKSGFYHGGLTLDEKDIAFTNWTDEKTPIMVATNAFGMGIDKANVRAVIHINLPQSIENYIQETGRAGRDGKKSFAFLLYNNNTISDFKKIIQKGLATPKVCKEIYINLNKYYQISLGEKPEKHFDFILQDFCNHFSLPVLTTYNAITTLEIEGIIEFTQSINKNSIIKIKVSNNDLFLYQKRNPNTKRIIQILLRTYGGLFDQFTNVNEYNIANKLQVTKLDIIKSLNQLNNDNILIYKYFKGLSQIKFLVPREDNYTINSISKNVKKRNKIKIEKANSVIGFIENNTICRSVQLQHYFGEKDMIKCNICDICTYKKPAKADYNIVANGILNLLINDQVLTSYEIVNGLSFDENIILNTLQFLIEKKAIGLTSQNKYKKL
ncbi:MAG: RecQ family ATP-dependent DNA helicase [Bacteroidota bacterium]